jgi:hypothetical protein
VVPISKAVFVQGRSEDPRIGEFAGFVVAKALGVPGGAEERGPSSRYWVHDASKRAPVWVRLDEIRRWHWPRRNGGPPVRQPVLHLDGEPAAGPAVASLNST